MSREWNMKHFGTIANILGGLLIAYLHYRASVEARRAAQESRRTLQDQ